MENEKKSFKGKLSLHKETVSHLSNKQMNHVKGGALWTAYRATPNTCVYGCDMDILIGNDNCFGDSGYIHLDQIVSGVDGFIQLTGSSNYFIL